MDEKPRCTSCERRIARNNRYLITDDGDAYHLSCYKREFGELPPDIKNIDEEHLEVISPVPINVLEGLATFLKTKGGKQSLNNLKGKTLLNFFIEAENKKFIPSGNARKYLKITTTFLKGLQSGKKGLRAKMKKPIPPQAVMAGMNLLKEILNTASGRRILQVSQLNSKPNPRKKTPRPKQIPPISDAKGNWKKLPHFKRIQVLKGLGLSIEKAEELAKFEYQKMSKAIIGEFTGKLQSNPRNNGNPFALFIGPEFVEQRQKATKEIKMAIDAGDFDKVRTAMHRHMDVGAEDTESREAIIIAFEKKHKTKIDWWGSKGPIINPTAAEIQAGIKEEKEGAAKYRDWQDEFEDSADLMEQFRRDELGHAAALQQMMKNPGKLATLTADEDRAWEEYFSFHIDNGLSDDEADQMAWADLKQVFPRLIPFEGISESKTRKALQRGNPKDFTKDELDIVSMYYDEGYKVDEISGMAETSKAEVVKILKDARVSPILQPKKSIEGETLRFFIPKLQLNNILEDLGEKRTEWNRRHLLHYAEAAANIELDYGFGTPEDILLPEFWSDDAKIPDITMQPPGTYAVDIPIYQGVDRFLEQMEKPITDRNREHLKHILWDDLYMMIESDFMSKDELEDRWNTHTTYEIFKYYPKKREALHSNPAAMIAMIVSEVLLPILQKYGTKKLDQWEKMSIAEREKFLEDVNKSKQKWLLATVSPVAAPLFISLKSKRVRQSIAKLNVGELKELAAAAKESGAKGALKKKGMKKLKNPDLTQKQIDSWFENLEHALIHNHLPTSKGGHRKASADEFMLMEVRSFGEYKPWKVAYFKHSPTRNYLQVYESGKIHIPKSGKPFHKGYFDSYKKNPLFQRKQKRSYGHVQPGDEVYHIESIDYKGILKTIDQDGKATVLWHGTTTPSSVHASDIVAVWGTSNPHKNSYFEDYDIRTGVLSELYDELMQDYETEGSISYESYAHYLAEVRGQHEDDPETPKDVPKKVEKLRDLYESGDFKAAKKLTEELENAFPKSNPARWKHGSELQSVIFHKDRWTAAAAKKWLRDHGKKIPKTDSEKNYYRFRQAEPGKFIKGHYATIPFGKGTGIFGLIAEPKKVTSSNPLTKEEREHIRKFASKVSKGKSNPSKAQARKTAQQHRDKGHRSRVMKIHGGEFGAFIDGARAFKSNPTKAQARAEAKEARDAGKLVRVMPTADGYNAFIDGERMYRRKKGKKPRPAPRRKKAAKPVPKPKLKKEIKKISKKLKKIEKEELPEGIVVMTVPDPPKIPKFKALTPRSTQLVAELFTDADEIGNEIKKWQKKIEKLIKTANEEIKTYPKRDKRRKILKSSIKELQDVIGKTNRDFLDAIADKSLRGRENFIKEAKKKGLVLEPDYEHEFADDVILSITQDPYVTNNWARLFKDVFNETLNDWLSRQEPEVSDEDIAAAITKELEEIAHEEPKRLTASGIPAIVKRIMPKHQQKVIIGSEEHWDVLKRIKEQAKEIPKLYAQEKLYKDAIVHLHYFTGGSDWFITEWDGKNEFFGYVILNADYQNSEFGYIPREELINTPPIELDFYWNKKTLQEALEKVDSEYYGKEEEEEEPPLKTKKELEKELKAVDKELDDLNASINFEYDSMGMVDPGKQEQLKIISEQRNEIIEQMTGEEPEPEEPLNPNTKALVKNEVMIALEDWFQEYDGESISTIRGYVETQVNDYLVNLANRQGYNYDDIKNYSDENLDDWIADKKVEYDAYLKKEEGKESEASDEDITAAITERLKGLLEE